jgi:hypothetical protein
VKNALSLLTLLFKLKVRHLLHHQVTSRGYNDNVPQKFR